MSLIHLENENFDELISHEKVLVDFYAEWCGPCKMLGPVLESVASEIETKIIKVDVDKCGNLATKYAVMSVPTLIVFENGKEIKKEIGFLSKEKIIDLVK